jgi:hypothetical protein
MAGRRRNQHVPRIRWPECEGADRARTGNRSTDMSSFFEAAEATSSSFCGGTGMANVRLPSVWSENDSGQRPQKERFV